MSYNDDITGVLANHRLVLFGGAGLARDAGLPDWRGLVLGLKDKLLEERKLLREFVVPIDLLVEKRNLISALELMLADIPRRDIVRIVRMLLAPKRESEVCKTIAKMKPPGVITTNYDRVLDSCLDPGLYRLNNSFEGLALVNTAVGSGRPFLLKLHGDIDNELDPTDPLVAKGFGFMVLSKSDYAVAMQGQRFESLTLALHSVLLQYSVLFVGYSYTDPDIDWVMRFLADWTAPL